MPKNKQGGSKFKRQKKETLALNKYLNYPDQKLNEILFVVKCALGDRKFSVKPILNNKYTIKDYSPDIQTALLTYETFIGRLSNKIRRGNRVEKDNIVLGAFRDFSSDKKFVDIIDKYDLSDHHTLIKNGHISANFNPKNYVDVAGYTNNDNKKDTVDNETGYYFDYSVMDNQVEEDNEEEETFKNNKKSAKKNLVLESNDNFTKKSTKEKATKAKSGKLNLYGDDSDSDSDNSETNVESKPGKTYQKGQVLVKPEEIEDVLFNKPTNKPITEEEIENL